MSTSALTRAGVSGAAVAAYALSYQGTRYLWGGADPNGFDCSGFAQWVYRHAAGVSLPRTSYEQAGAGVAVSGPNYQPGDLLFFNGNEHEGISLGGSRFIHAPHTGDVVRIGTLGNGYEPDAARRILSSKDAAASGSSSGSWGEWATAFLRRAGLPMSSNNERFVLGWMDAENPGPDYAWNPLATTLKTSGATRSSGVQAYKDELAGIDATVQTIEGGQYPELRRMLAGSAPVASSWDALRRSPWDAGHYASQPQNPYQPGDERKLVTGAKKDPGGGGVLGGITGALGDIPNPFNLPGDVAGAVGGAASDAAGAALGPVGDAISSATSAVVSEAESLAVRAAYILIGLTLAAFAGILVVKSVGGPGAGELAAAAIAA